jgi:hypothetical protein
MDIYPLEVWARVLGHCKRVRDILNLIATCRDLASEKRVDERTSVAWVSHERPTSYGDLFGRLWMLIQVTVDGITLRITNPQETPRFYAIEPGIYCLTYVEAYLPA